MRIHTNGLVFGMFLYEGPFLWIKNKFYCFQFDIGWFAPYFAFWQQIEFSSDVFRIALNVFGLIDFEFRLSRREDHAGLRFSIGIPVAVFEFTIYDNRHWDDEAEAWVTYGEGLHE